MCSKNTVLKPEQLKLKTSWFESDMNDSSILMRDEEKYVQYQQQH